MCGEAGCGAVVPAERHDLVRPDWASPQAQQEVVAGDQRQIHDLSGSSEKPVRWVAVRQWQLLGRQHDLVGERHLPLLRIKNSL